MADAPDRALELVRSVRDLQLARAATAAAQEAEVAAMQRVVRALEDTSAEEVTPVALEQARMRMRRWDG